jgi:hypothetical protein
LVKLNKLWTIIQTYLGAKNGVLPLRYLGIPIHFRKIRNADWKRVEERFEKRFSSWKGNHLSNGGRLTLVNSVLSSLPLYMMSFFAVPRGVLKKLDYFQARFFLATRGEEEISSSGMERSVPTQRPRRLRN